jgi:hypothetical protein
MSAIISAKWLVTSGCLAIFLSSLFGILLLTPSVRTAENTMRLKQLGKAHVDWILLGLMSVAAGTLGWLYELNLHPAFIALIIFGAWTNPFPYVFRAYGIDAFQFSGSLSQRSSAAFAALSVAAVLIGWSGILVQVARTIL